jgi:hypothetical protein
MKAFRVSSAKNAAADSNDESDMVITVQLF